MERNLTWTNRISPGEGSGLRTEHNSFSVNNHTRRDSYRSKTVKNGKGSIEIKAPERYGNANKLGWFGRIK
ncbi:protein of unknown function [Methylocaldum szegediense]|uniref:Uncharacterized protein n=1 Tax=Methylocaldum szegediense TaxID=73780 RepID=A0ABM9I922_9GAMM|nr:protein of unknown function [Methylocaldum szegediense]